MLQTSILPSLLTLQYSIITVSRFWIVWNAVLVILMMQQARMKSSWFLNYHQCCATILNILLHSLRSLSSTWPSSPFILSILFLQGSSRLHSCCYIPYWEWFIVIFIILTSDLIYFFVIGFIEHWILSQIELLGAMLQCHAGVTCTATGAPTQATTRRWPAAGLMLGQRLRR